MTGRLGAVLIAGPTASGKSALALGLARRLGGVVVNADSQQVYDGWRILTARPTPEEMARAPHRLYGHVPLGAAYSTGLWLRDCAGVLAELDAAGRPAVIVGGTGLYFAALTGGIAPIPPVPGALRAEGERQLERLGLAAFAARLAARDPATAAALDRANPVRVLRAWEVLELTGAGLAAWCARTGPPLVPPDRARRIALVPPRSVLHARIEARLDAMVAAGVLEEVRAAMAQGLAPGAPAMKAVGAAAFMAHLRGEIARDAAVAAAGTATRRYAKRQLTWVRNQMADWRQIGEPVTPEAIPRLLDAILA